MFSGAHGSSKLAKTVELSTCNTSPLDVLCGHKPAAAVAAAAAAIIVIYMDHARFNYRCL